jgi:hypothetical protein
MANFEGYLIKFIKSGEIFPTELIALESYKSTPLQRTEIKAYRDSDNYLRRITSPNFKSKLEFTTIRLNLAQMRIIRKRLNSAFQNSQQRKLKIKYWDDELLCYREMTAYIPDITYQYKKISSDNIEYMPVSFTFIEY